MTDVITNVAHVTPVWLGERLRAHDYAAQVTNVSATHVRTSNVSIVYRLAVQYTNHATAPTHLFLKIATSPDFGMGDREFEFYRTVAPVMQIVPDHPAWPLVRCYDTTYDATTNQSHLLLEDLSDTHESLDTYRPFTTPEFQEQVVDALARLHAFWWEHERLGKDISQRPTVEFIADLIVRGQQNFVDCLDFMGERLSAEQRATLARVCAAWPARRVQRLVNGIGITLVHRDTHPNAFLYPRETSPDRKVRLIDWQSWRVQVGTDDLAYTLACHWYPNLCAAAMQTLVRRYHANLLTYGVKDYDWNNCWYDYRASVLRCLFMLVGGWLPRQGDMNWGRIYRGLQACAELDCMELLAS